MPGYSEAVTFSWNIAEHEARGVGDERIEPAHLLMALTKLVELPLSFMGDATLLLAERDRLRAVFDVAQVNTAGLRHGIRKQLTVRYQVSAVPLVRSPATERVLEASEAIAQQNACDHIQTLHLLFALLQGDWFAALELSELFDQNSLLNATRHEVSRGQQMVVGAPRAAEQPSATPYLDRYGRDLTRMAIDGELTPIIGRHDEIKSVCRQLLHIEKPNPILVGEAGVGKTQIVEGVAQRIVAPNPPAGLDGRRLVEVFMWGVMAGTEFRGQFEERFHAILFEAAAADVILFIDEIHTIMEAGGQGASDASNILKPFLARGDIRLIGATTWKEYRKYIEKDDAIKRRLPMIHVKEPSRDDTLAIVCGRKSKFESHYGLKIQDEALASAVQLAERYLTGCFPDKAINLVEDACAAALVRTDTDLESAQTLESDQVIKVVAKMTGLPAQLLGRDDKDHLSQMRTDLSRRVIGQDEAVEKVCRTIRMAQAGLKDPQRPTAVFLFVGSTGTGKTELAKALTDWLYHDERRLLRFDMSEYSDKLSKNRLVGAPAGYVGYDDDGQLVAPMREDPHRVVLFDEIEKAHADVLDLFLQIFDEGRLTDTQGREASFHEATIILTSNLGSESRARNPIGFGKGSLLKPDDYREQIETALSAALRPEILNRISEVAFFYPLDEDSQRQIIDKLVDQLHVDSLNEMQIQLTLSPECYEYLVQANDQPQFGAREMDRIFQRLVKQPLADAMLESRVSNGDELRVVLGEGGIVFEKTIQST